MSARTYTLPTTELDRWKAILERCGRYDVYHTAEYHHLAEQHGSGRAVLLACETPGCIVAMPLLLRETAGLPGIPSSQLCDVTSVHGYAGPVSSTPRPSQEALQAFGRHSLDYFAQQRVVCAFSRLHPLLDGQEAVLSATGGQVLGAGQTVAIDLTLPLDQQWRQYRTNHKRDIRRAQEQGVHCIHDPQWRYLDAFVEMYDQTMQRVQASPYYLFDRSYFTRLRDLLRDKVHLFVALQGDAVSSAALFTVCGGIIQYFLGATDRRFVRSSPGKLIFDTVRRWGTEHGASVLHLGGGVGARADSLIHVTGGGSRRRYPFRTWRWVLDPPAYEELVLQKRAWNHAQGLESTDPHYFPAYRGPTRRTAASGRSPDGR